MIEGKNGSSGYTKPAPFVAYIANDALAGIRTAQAEKIASTDDQAKAVLRICEQKEEFSALVADGGKEVSEALQSLADMRLFCLAEVAGAREKQEAAPS